MGYKDKMGQLTGVSGQTVTADADSTDYLDFEVTNPADNEGRIVGFLITVMTKTTAGTGIIFEIVQKSTEPTHADAVLASFRILAADLVVGKELFLPLPQGATLLRMMRLYFDVIAGTESYKLACHGLLPWSSK